MKRKVCIFGSYPPPYGGVAIFNKALFENLKDYEPVLWAYGEYDKYEQKTNIINVNSLKKLLLAFLKFSYKSIIIESTIHFIEYPNGVLIFNWILQKMLFSFKWIKVVHDSTLPVRFNGFGKFDKLLFKLSLSHIDQLVVVSNELKEWFQSNFKVSKNINVIGSSLPIPESELDDCLKKNLQQKMKVYEKIVSSIGFFTEEYGFREVVQAIENLRNETNIDFGLILIDGGVITNNDYKYSILEDREWITVLESVSHQEVLAILRNSDVFVRNTRYESYGLSRVESIMVNTPVVATDVGETRGMYTYKCGDNQAMLEQIKHSLLKCNDKEINIWAQHYKQNAYSNLTAFRKLMNMIGEKYNEIV